MVHFIGALAPLLLFVEKAVLILLVGLEAVVIALFVWRLRCLRQSRGDAGKWNRLLSGGLGEGNPFPVQVGEGDAATLPGRVVRTGIDNIGLSPEALERVFEVQESMEKRSLNRGLAFLATVGSNAPFLGLTGTVIGILVAFDRFAASGGRGSGDVMVSISHALIATAIGLMVAIPAVVFYNILRNQSTGILEEAREIRGLIMAHSLQRAYSGTGV